MSDNSKFKFSDMVLFNLTTPLHAFVCQLIYPAINYQAKTCKVWALPVSLATTPRIVIYFLFLDLLRCFSSVGSRQLSYFIQIEMP